MKENKDMKCDPCEQNFEQNIHRIVREGKAPTHEQREKKSSEVKAAFGVHHPEKKAEAKKPAMAGAAKAKK